ncbi:MULTISPECIES: F0F1 ATP synthase subunit B [unclassified Campylobacter]|uniref:F0F1 ATP synthase subunit B n=1 Tax=Campylobacter TaxID=194 RepID=UPI0014728AD8|nr:MULTISPECIES: F0F1 ATP synthase subunit B [unclassified Campylobacter]QKF92814.1 ATP synthase, F0 complex, b subunit [Campylobacter sp. CCUG 57310]
MKKFYLVLFIPFLLTASEPSGNGYDIVARTINFVLFFGILYYFIATPIKNAYKARIQSIANRLDGIQKKLKESQVKKDDALRRVEEAKSNAISLVETSKKEAMILSEKIKNETNQELLNMEKSFEEQKEFERRRMTKVVVGEVLNEIFASDSMKIDQNELVNIVLKKVG